MKYQVFRHLLYNKGSQPAQSERYKLFNKSNNNHVKVFKNKYKPLTHLFKLGTTLIVADAFVKWVHSRMFGKIFTCFKTLTFVCF